MSTIVKTKEVAASGLLTEADPEGEPLAATCQRVSKKLPGLKFDVALFQRGKSSQLIDWAEAPGKAPSERSYDIGCLQNSLCGAVLWALGSEGRIDPQQLVGEYLPGLKNAGRGPGDLIKVVDLVRHSSGYLSSAQETVGWNGFLDYLFTEGPAFPPGEIVNYFGPEHRILKRLIYRVTGRSVWDEIESRLYHPLGLEFRSGQGGQSETAYRSVFSDTNALLRVIQYILSADGPWGGAFLRDMDRDLVRAMRSKQALSTRLPIGYSWGFARFDNGLWGGSGFSGDDGLGIRFNAQADFMVAAAVSGHQVRRDLFLEEFCATCGFKSAQPARRAPLGAVVGLDAANIQGTYRSGPTLAMQVFVDGGHLECASLQDGQMVGSIRGFILDDGTIMGDTRLPGVRLEFFPHPVTGGAAMSLGLTAYVRA